MSDEVKPAPDERYNLAGPEPQLGKDDAQPNEAEAMTPFALRQTFIQHQQPFFPYWSTGAFLLGCTMIVYHLALWWTRNGTIKMASQYHDGIGDDILAMRHVQRLSARVFLARLWMDPRGLRSRIGVLALWLGSRSIA
jgi:hypothetical protein